MTSTCQKCLGTLDDEPYVFICSSDCTFCRKCAATLRGVCPDCGAGLERRALPKDDE